MKIYQTLVRFLEGGETTEVDTIEYEGKLWLVPEWFYMPTEGVTIPARIIQLDSLAYQIVESPIVDCPNVDYVLNDPLSIKLLNGLTQTQEGLEVVVLIRPDIQIQSASSIH